MNNKVMDELLYLYDFTIRLALDQDDYECGYADGVGQCVLDVGKVLGETGEKPYKFEAFKRVMHFETVEKYIADYPTPVERVDV